MNTRTFSALAEPNRLRIVELLRDRPHSVNEIATHLELRQPQVSKHLQSLSKAGLVTVHPVAQQRIYALQPEPFQQLDDWLNSFERSWTKRLSKLDVYLERMKEG
ncbi:MAG: TrmB family transcriptional regulator [Chloroflexi bacterium]|jgi:DNA-binding transcriptional ArsR family regulator|nr:TrmB family transcriptional regulator [Chloroflexota bacterium]